MTTNSHGSATGSAWTLYYRRQVFQGHEGCKMLCNQATWGGTTTISSLNYGTCPRRAWGRLRFLIAMAIFLLPFGVYAENALYRFDSDRELLFDRRTPPAMQMRIGDSSISPIPRQRSGLDSSLLSRSGSSIPLPSPFDSSIGDNFTSSTCPAFFETFLHNATFQQCLPFSLLLQTSNGFFEATRSATQLTRILDATCNVNYQQCSALMASYAEQIQSRDHCGADLRLQNPLVEQAYNGFIAYQPMYQAGCLKDSNGNFCFADAATNTSSPASSYIYYLPLGMQLPTTVWPTCNSCLRETMAIFATYAGDADQKLSGDYTTAAQQVESYCDFGHVKLPVEATSGVSVLRPTNYLAFWIWFLVVSYFLP